MVKAARRLALAALLWAAPAFAGPLELDGPLVQGGLVLGRADPGARLVLDGRAVRVAADGRFVIGFGRDAPPEAVLTVTSPAGAVEERRLAIAQRSYDVQRIEGLPDAMVTPSEADLKRIASETERVAAARTVDSAVPYFLDGFVWPALGPISGVYGSQRILNGEPRRPHFGVDVAAPEGTAVRAPAAGVVALADPDLYFTGGTVILDHGHGLSSTFSHLQDVAVEIGDRLAPGDPIGTVGATGRVTGAHLDWRMNWFDTRLDPQLVVGPMPAAADTGLATHSD